MPSINTVSKDEWVYSNRQGRWTKINHTLTLALRNEPRAKRQTARAQNVGRVWSKLQAYQPLPFILSS